MFLFREKQLLTPLTVRDVLVVLVGEGREGDGGEGGGRVGEEAGQLKEVVKAIGIPSYAMKPSLRQFLTYDIAHLKRTYSKYIQWQGQILRRERQVTRLKQILHTFEQSTSPAIRRQQESISSFQDRCQALLGKVKQARLSVSLVQRYSAARVQRIQRLMLIKSNLTRLLAFLKKAVADPSVIEMLQKGQERPAQRIRAFDRALDALKEDRGQDQSEALFKGMLVKFTQNARHRLIGQVSASLQQSFSKLRADYGALLQAYQLIQHELSFDRLRDLPTMVEDLLFQQQRSIKATKDPTDHLLAFLPCCSAMMDNWQLLNRWHAAHPDESPKLGAELLEMRRTVWAKIQDRVLRMMRVEAGLSEMAELAVGLKPVLKKGRLFSKQISIDKKLKEMYDNCLDAFLKDVKQDDLPSPQHCNTLFTLLSIPPAPQLPILPTCHLPELECLLISLMQHCKMIQFYPYSSKRLLGHWLIKARALVKECLGESLGGYTFTVKKVSPEDFDVVVPLLEKARVGVLVKGRCAGLKALMQENLPFVKCQNSALQIIQSFKDLIPKVLPVLKQLQGSAILDALPQLLQGCVQYLQEQQLRSQLEEELGRQKVQFIGGRKEGCWQVQVKREQVWLKLYAEQVLLLLSRQTKGGDSNRTAMKAEIMATVKLVGPELGADLLRLFELWCEKNIAEVVKQIEQLRLREMRGRSRRHRRRAGAPSHRHVAASLLVIRPC